MNTQDIIKSLSNLEHSLQGVESARQQVDSTVAAYGATQKQLATLSQEFVKVSNELGSVIDVVRNNQEQLSATLSSKIEHLLIQIEGKVAVLGNKASLMNQTFESSCTETAKSINDSIDAAITSFKEKVKDELSEVSTVFAEFSALINEIQERFEKYALQQAISTLQETCEKIVIDFQQKIANHLSSLSKLNGELEAIVNIQKNQNDVILKKFEAETALIKASLTNIDSQLEGMKSCNDENHNELLAKFEKESTSIQASTSNIDRQLKGMKSCNDENHKEILDKFETEVASIKASTSNIDNQLKGMTIHNDEHHKELLELLSALLQGNSPSAEILTTRFNAVDGSIVDVKDRLSSVSSQLGNATNHIIEHNKQILLSEVASVKAENTSIKKLVVFCLLVTFISVILNIIMLL